MKKVFIFSVVLGLAVAFGVRTQGAVPSTTEQPIVVPVEKTYLSPVLVESDIHINGYKHEVVQEPAETAVLTESETKTDESQEPVAKVESPKADKPISSPKPKVEKTPTPAKEEPVTKPVTEAAPAPVNPPEPAPVEEPAPEPTPAPEPAPAPVEEPKPEPAAYTSNSSLEKAILEETNRYRAENGLNPLTWDNGLAESARAHTVYLFENTLFEHTKVYNVGENLYRLGSADTGKHNAKFIVQKWIDSPGHRENLLDPSYKKMGVSVLVGKRYYEKYKREVLTLYATQHFYY